MGRRGWWRQGIGVLAGAMLWGCSPPVPPGAVPPRPAAAQDTAGPPEAPAAPPEAPSTPPDTTPPADPRVTPAIPLPASLQSVEACAADARTPVRRTHVTGPAPEPLAVGDVDGDGWQDVVVVNHHRGFTNQYALHKGSAVLLRNDGRGGLQVREPLGAFPYPRSVLVADVDARTSGPEVVVGASAGYVDAPALQVFSGAGGGPLRRLDGGLGFPQERPDLCPNGCGLSTVELLGADDLDGDGHTDLAHCTGTAYHTAQAWLSGTRTCRTIPWANPNPDSAGDWRFAFTALDVDGDGRLDAMRATNTTLQVSRGTDAGAWTPTEDIVAEVRPLAALDLDGDGAADLVELPVASDQSVAWRRNDRHGSFEEARDAGLGPGLWRTAHLDGDGVLDLWAAHPSEPTVRILLAARSGAAPLVLALPARAERLEAHDLDGDGTRELVAHLADGTLWTHALGCAVRAAAGP